MGEHRFMGWFPDDDDFDFEWDPIKWQRHIHERVRKHQERLDNERGESGMSAQEIHQLMMAIKALMKAVERSLATESYEGVADTMVENYRALHTRIVEHYPDDYYVKDVLAIKVPEGANDRQKVSLVQLAASQMFSYLRSLGEGEDIRFRFRGAPRHRPHRGHGPDMHGHDPHSDFGREISEEVMKFTKETLRRALSRMEDVLDFEDAHMPPTPPPPPEKPKRKRRIEVELDVDDDDDDSGFI